MKIEVVANDGNLCGEAPLWDSERGVLLWVDMSSSLVYEFDPSSGERRTVSRDLMAAGLARAGNESFIFAGATGMHAWSLEMGHRTFLTEHSGETLFFNDLIADSQGRVYAGTCYWGPAQMEKYGKLYLLGTDGSVSVADDGIELSNGLGLSGDQRTLYYADSTARSIYAYEVDPATGTLANRRKFVQVPAEEGLPDGLTVDAEDHVWSAQWYGGQIVRYDPEGKVERRITLPASQISSLAFGGSDFTDLYVTSAAEFWDSSYLPRGFHRGSRPPGGALYRIRTEIPGRPEPVARIPSAL